MRHEEKEYDFVVVGGGMAGTVAAISAARHGASTALIQDRPVLGGNASSEIRMHICGALGVNNRETGILEELILENHYRNPIPNYSIWDSVIYGKARYQKNLDVYLNATVCDLEMDGTRISSIKAWQFTNETWWKIKAKLFADCSGDGILAPLAGAEFRIGRESRREYGESIAPAREDSMTMGLSCLFQAREYDSPRTFIAPDWACKFTRPEDLRGRIIHLRKTNHWWMEVGGDRDSIHDSEELRDELLRISFGVWDYIKNHSPEKETFSHWDLDWQGFLPGKRESRRYSGDFVLTQGDVESGGRFPDLVAYGGWSMDDHFPAGFYHPARGTTYHSAPSPYGIPYRSLYSRNIVNLFCAGRDHSASHVAMSSTRVMGTCSVMGQAVGTAAALAVSEGTSPRGVYEKHLVELRNLLMEDDAWLPFSQRSINEITRNAEFAGQGEGLDELSTGRDRPDVNGYNGWTGRKGDRIEIRLQKPACLDTLRFVFDSDLNRLDNTKQAQDEEGRRAKNMRHYYSLHSDEFSVPNKLIKNLLIEAKGSSGRWETAGLLMNNYQRLAYVTLGFREPVYALRITPLENWGDDKMRIFSIDLRQG